MSISNAVRNMGELLYFVYILQTKILNEYVTYLLPLRRPITMLGDSNSSIEMGGKCFYNFLLVSELSLLCCCVA